MRLDRPLDEVFRTGSHVRILRALVAVGPSVNLSGRDVARRARLSQSRTAEVLTDLEEQGLVIARRFDTYGFFELNRAHVAAAVLEDLFGWEVEQGEEFHAFLRRKLAGSPYVRAAFVAPAEDATDPRLLLAVVHAPGRGEETWAQMDDLERDVEERFGVRLSTSPVPDGWTGQGPARRILDVGTLVFRARLPAAEAPRWRRSIGS